MVQDQVEGGHEMGKEDHTALDQLESFEGKYRNGRVIPDLDDAHTDVEVVDEAILASDEREGASGDSGIQEVDSW
jgi:hypothetical protein